ncbi:hypothetical protein TB2_008766 [Malus domestica]|uniref:uncharacterized protein LOC126593964 isoform X1 n=1 Tax=Malus sylvestris TaxID=3752 RepID=UPI0021ACD3A9|nr:uncharacterized protein LOC126593964 isoform X1 [Malus sylvestris]
MLGTVSSPLQLHTSGLVSFRLCSRQAGTTESNSLSSSPCKDKEIRRSKFLSSASGEKEINQDFRVKEKKQEINQACPGEEQSEDTMVLDSDHYSSDDSVSSSEICRYCDYVGEHTSWECPNYLKPRETWVARPLVKESYFCSICGKNDHHIAWCPLAISCPPGTKVEPGAEIMCSVCHTYMCSIESQYWNIKYDHHTFAQLKDCLYCNENGHYPHVCPSRVKDLLAVIELENAGDDNNGQDDDNEKPNTEFQRFRYSFFVANLAPQVTEIDLYRHFLDLLPDVGIGDVTEVMVHNHEDKCYGYLEFRTRETALSAMEKGHHTILCDKKIKCYPSSLVKEGLVVFSP